LLKKYFYKKIKFSKMKKIFLFISSCLLISSSFAQNGLEHIIVEKYYISNENDANADAIGGTLPVGSVTYRVYVDMAPGYNFQAAFGLANQELRIETTTLFFNNTDFGNTTPIFSKSAAANNTVMLDSWLSVGAACMGNFGVLKTDDNGLLTNINDCSGCGPVSQVLLGNDPEAGIPLTVQDGLLAGTPLSAFLLGLETIINVFGAESVGNLFSTTNGSWAAFGGAVGPDAATNRVLIGQFTTDGTFSFRLNIQLGTPSGGTERYVSSNPTASDIEFSELIYNSSVLTNLNWEKKNNPTTIFKIYPNPINDNFFVELESKEKYSKNNTVTISTIEGATIYSKEFEINSEIQTEQIDFNKFSKGVYLIKLNLGGVISTKKLIKI
jgi:hypothetical protein